ncbi:MAG TPA: hypothetical protein VF144_05700 [Chitinophagaceae bacterium]
MTILLITLLIRKLRKWQQKKQLHWQKALGSKGIGFRTRIMQVLEDAKLFNGYKRIHVVAMIRINGKKVSYRMHTWLKQGETLHEGERVVIRYQPGVHNVLIRQVTK